MIERLATKPTFSERHDRTHYIFFKLTDFDITPYLAQQT